MKKLKSVILIILIFLLGLSLRLYGIDWDHGQHLHPDERFLTMVASTIQLPSGITQYLNTATSPLNPYNYPDYQFFVYGTFPLFLTRFLAQLLNFTSYDQIHLLGRFLSAFFDSLSIITLFFLSRLIFKKDKSKFQFLPSLIYAVLVLPIQLSHFFAVDTFLNFFLLLTFTLLSYWLVRRRLFFLIFAAISYGLSLACKISALYFAPIIALFFLYLLLKNRKFFPLLPITFYFILISFLIFRFFQPYSFTGLFTLNPQFISNIRDLQSWSEPSIYFPPSVQWLSKTPIIFPLKNIVFWGIGLSFSILFVIFFYRFILQIINSRHPKKFLDQPVRYIIFLSAIWIVFLFIYQGIQPAATMRYFLLLYPFFSLLLSYFLSFRPQKIITAALIGFSFIYTLAFLNIYSHPHSRVQASIWIYKNIPAGSNITNEYWDDALPLNLNNHYSSIYQNKMLPLYDPDSPEKWADINEILDHTDYMFLTSNRLWGSIPKVPKLYPITSQFYFDLFDANSQFTKVAEFNSYPGFPLSFLKKCFYIGPTDYPTQKIRNHFFETNECSYPGIYFRDDTAEEAFTVYDHPKVQIFRRQL